MDVQRLRRDGTKKIPSCYYIIVYVYKGIRKDPAVKNGRNKRSHRRIKHPESHTRRSHNPRKLLERRCVPQSRAVARVVFEIMESCRRARQRYKKCMKACARKRVKLWFVPPRSPDLNPVERFWAWLRKELRRRDLDDLRSKRPVLGKTAYKQRVRNVFRSQKAQQAAKNLAKSFKKTCQKVVRLRGAHSGK